MKLLAAMANVHMSILKRLLPPLFLPTHPQLLTRGSYSCNSRRMRRAECMRCFWPSLCVGCAAVDLLLAVLVEVHTRGIQHDAVCSMLARFDTKHLRVQRPTTEAATAEAVQQIIAAALAIPPRRQAAQTAALALAQSPDASSATGARKRKSPATSAAATDALSEDGHSPPLPAAEAASAAASPDHSATASSRKRRHQEALSAAAADGAGTEPEGEERQPDIQRCRTVSPTRATARSAPAPSLSSPLSLPRDAAPQRMEIDGELGPAARATASHAPSLPCAPNCVATEHAASPASAAPAAERMTTREEKQLAEAMKRSQADQAQRPSMATTPQQRKAYDEYVQQHLQRMHRHLRKVPGNGDCLLASVLLGCEAAGIDVCAERGLKSMHASHLRTYMASWIRAHKQVLFDLSGGDDSWRGDVVVQKRTRRTNRGSSASSPRLTLDGCLDLFADPTEREWDIPWASPEAGAPETNLGDYMPQLIATALDLRIVLIKAHGSPETAGVRDPFGQLVADASREVVIVQSVGQDHWHAALPLPSAAATTAAAAAAASSPSAPVAAVSAAPPSDAAIELQGHTEIAASAPVSPRACCPASQAPVTPASGLTSATDESPVRREIQGARRRIFADSPSSSHELAALQKQLAQAQSALEDSQRKHVTKVQQLQQQHAMEVKQLEECHVAALAEQTLRSETAATTTHSIERAVTALMHARPNHKSRVRGGSSGDMTAEALEELAELCTSLPPSSVLPFFHVSPAMVEQWTHDVEELETALGSPFRPDDPQAVDEHAAQQVCQRLEEWLAQLDDDEWQPTFMEQLLLCKRLMCVDQLRPKPSQDSGYEELQVRALLPRLLSHKRVWSFAVHLPSSYLASTRDQMRRKSAKYYVRAARAAAPDVLQQARLLVEQCKVLDSGGMLDKANELDSIELEYPEAPFTHLQSLHSQYADAGPPLDRDAMQQLDTELRQWHAALHAAQRRADELAAQRAGSTAVKKAQAEIDELAASGPPRSFEQRMNKSKMFFHPDKRKHDQQTSNKEQAAQFAQVKEAWACLSACRSRFQELRTFRDRVQASK